MCTNKQNRLDLGPLFCMSEVSKVNSFMYYVLSKKFKMVLNIFAHNFPYNKWIFNLKKKVLES